jgi:hypothetical protein
VKGPTRPPQPSNRGARGGEAIEQALARFQERLRALERECQIFRTFSGWKDDSHLARARELHRELNTLERTLSADRSLRQQLAFQQRNLLLRYQAFKRTYRQFWEQLTA